MAKVLSSISGNLISAASAGFAPTNGADVSAIASAYQVVSATGTQLYASTAHVTSINNAPISASRAGNAANAAMATSAYYDGTGRLISSLPDSATVSAIASSYAESAASGKLDSGNYISATGLNQRISNAAGTQQVSFASGTNGTAAGVWMTGQFGTAYYKDNELKLNRGSGQIAFNIGGQGPKITASAGGNYASVIYTMNANESAEFTNLGVTMKNTGGVTGVYKNTGISGNNSSNNGFWAYGSSEYNKLTSVHDTVSANSATWASASAISSYALSADVSSTIDTVSAQSANWGGSALALSAGPGIVFNKVGDTLVASVDETVLFTSDSGEKGNIALSEPFTNFEKISVTFDTMPTCGGAEVRTFDCASIVSNGALFLYGVTLDGSNINTLVVRKKRLTLNAAKTQFTVTSYGQTVYDGSSWTQTTYDQYCRVFKVVGVNRIAGA